MDCFFRGNISEENGLFLPTVVNKCQELFSSGGGFHEPLRIHPGILAGLVLCVLSQLPFVHVHSAVHVQQILFHCGHPLQSF